MGLAIPVLSEIFGVVKSVASEAITDKDKKNELLFRVRELEDRANERLHSELMGQVEINKQEAAHPSVFVAGWRPAVGWVGVLGLFWTFLLSPFLDIFVDQMPVIDTDNLMTLVLGMLGLGGMRSFEKIKGVGATGVSLKGPQK